MRLGKRHIVRPGESLKTIAYAYYMDMDQWPVIFEHNQLFQVKGHTGREIISPDLLLVGQVIYLPDIPPAPRTPKQMYSGMLKRPQPPEWRRKYLFAKANTPAKRLEGVTFEYSLDQIPDIIITHTAFTAVVKLSGKVSLQSQQGFDFMTVTKDDFTLACKREADTALGSLMSGMEVDFTFGSRRTIFSNNLTAKMGYANGVETAMSIAANPPRFKAAITFPAKAGIITPDSSLGQYKCEVSGFKVSIEITPHPPVRTPGPEPQPAYEVGRIKRMSPIAVSVGVSLLIGAIVIASFPVDGVVVTTLAALAAAGLVLPKSAPGQKPEIVNVNFKYSE